MCPWALEVAFFLSHLEQSRRKLNARFTELQSSREHHFGSARSQSCGSTRSPKVREVALRIFVCCEKSHNLKIIIRVYAGHRRSIYTVWAYPGSCFLKDICLGRVDGEGLALPSFDASEIPEVGLLSEGYLFGSSRWGRSRPTIFRCFRDSGGWLAFRRISVWVE